MKTKQLLSLLFVALISTFCLTSINAQTTHASTLPSTAAQTVNVNSAYNYGVDSIERSGVSNIYNWTVSPGVAGTDYIITPAGNTANKRIQWLTANTYTVTVQESNPAAYGSCGPVTHPSVAVTVSATPTGTVQFASATGTNQCSVSPAAIYSANLTTSGTISYPITVNVTYTINSVTSTDVLTVASGDPLRIPASVGFSSSSTDDATRRVRIDSVTDNAGGTLTVGGTATHTLTIWAVPAATPIHHD